MAFFISLLNYDECLKQQKFHNIKASDKKKKLSTPFLSIDRLLSHTHGNLLFYRKHQTHDQNAFHSKLNFSKLNFILIICIKHLIIYEHLLESERKKLPLDCRKLDVM
jgi:hypothetical protein